MRYTKSFSLNDSNDTQRNLLARLSAEASVSSTVIDALDNWYSGASTTTAPDIDLSPVLERLDMLSEQIAHLARAVNRLQYSSGPRETIAQEVTDGITGEVREIEAELVPIDPNDNTPFIRGARNMARPGMRLQD
jgi:hypothetical protein